MAEFDKSVTVLKLRAARERLRRKGHQPYGRDDHEQSVIAYMRALRAKPRGERLSFQAIAERLNTQGTLTRYGKLWSRATVFQILSREE